MQGKARIKEERPTLTPPKIAGFSLAPVFDTSLSDSLLSARQPAQHKVKQAGLVGYGGGASGRGGKDAGQAAAAAARQIDACGGGRTEDVQLCAEGRSR